MSMKKNEENKAEILRMYFEEKKSSNEIVEIMKDKVSRPTVFLWIRKERERRTLESRENGQYIPLRERAFQDPISRIKELEKENFDLKKQVEVLTLALEKLLKKEGDYIPSLYFQMNPPHDFFLPLQHLQMF